MMVGNLVALDKCQGIQSVIIGKSIHCLMEKLVQVVTVHLALAAYGSNNLCDGLKYGIEGSVHTNSHAFGKETPTTWYRLTNNPSKKLDLRMCGRGDPKSRAYLRQIGTTD